MPNFLLDPGIAIYAAMAVALVVWLGIFAFLWRLDRLARELRRKLDQQPRAEAAARDARGARCASARAPGYE
jgi:CcmD family protein